MGEAHRRGIVHRDLKPANLFLTRAPDGSPVVKVLDFGISKNTIDSAQHGLTNPAALMGSPLYMSPEQMRSARDVDHRTDIWSLGAVLYELLAGSPPFTADSVPALIACIMQETPRSLADLRADLPEGLVAIVRRCLEKDRASRFNDVGELAGALSPYAPHRSMAVVERAARILGSIPPPPQSRSSVPAPSLVREAVSLQQGTAPGWAGNHGGTLESPTARRRSLALPIGAGIAVAAVAAVGYAVSARHSDTPIAVEPREAVVATQSVAPMPPTSVAPAPAQVPAPTPVAEPVVPVPESAAVAAPKSDAPKLVPAEKKPRAVASTAPSADAASSTETKPKSSLKMSIKR
jgi:serine/threonine-protein kinase